MEASNPAETGTLDALSESTGVSMPMLTMPPPNQLNSTSQQAFLVRATTEGVHSATAASAAVTVDPAQSRHSTTAVETNENTITTMNTTWGEVLWRARSQQPVQPPADAPKSAQMRYMSEQMDCFSPHHLLLGRYQLLGPDERRYGGAVAVPCMHAYLQ